MKGFVLENDVQLLADAIPGFCYREIPNSKRLERCCSDWPLLADVYRALSVRVAPSTSELPQDSVAALWED